MTGRDAQPASVLSPLPSVFSIVSFKVRQNTDVKIDTGDPQGYVCLAFAHRRT
jgi:hypothetical protein